MGYLRFVGVTANITDCLSEDKGSTPLRTANVVISLLVKRPDVKSGRIGFDTQ